MPIVLNGSGTISGVSAGGLPDGIIQAADLASGVGGKILQVVSVTKTNVFTVSGTTTFTDVPNLSVNITPSSSSNKILVVYDMAWGNSDGHASCRLMRDSTPIKIGDQAGSNKSRVTGQMHLGSTQDQYDLEQVAGSILDTPNTTSQVTYKMQIGTPYSSSYNVFCNYHYEGSDAAWAGRGASAITVMEVAA